MSVTCRTAYRLAEMWNAPIGPHRKKDIFTLKMQVIINHSAISEKEQRGVMFLKERSMENMH